MYTRLTFTKFIHCLGFFVNDQVKVLIMEPLLDILMSTAPESNISKVSELMLLTIFARHDSHRIGMYIIFHLYRLNGLNIKLVMTCFTG